MWWHDDVPNHYCIRSCSNTISNALMMEVWNSWKVGSAEAILNWRQCRSYACLHRWCPDINLFINLSRYHFLKVFCLPRYWQRCYHYWFFIPLQYYQKGLTLLKWFLKSTCINLGNLRKYPTSKCFCYDFTYHETPIFLTYTLYILFCKRISK